MQRAAQVPHWMRDAACFCYMEGLPSTTRSVLAQDRTRPSLVHLACVALHGNLVANQQSEMASAKGLSMDNTIIIIDASFLQLWLFSHEIRACYICDVLSQEFYLLTTMYKQLQTNIYMH